LGEEPVAKQQEKKLMEFLLEVTLNDNGKLLKNCLETTWEKGLLA
jgi:hypothetical protein